LVSYVYTEMEKLNPQTVLHERETTSSGRPKAGHDMPSEDENCYYTYTRSGKSGGCQPKTQMEKYWDWLKSEAVTFQNSDPRFGKCHLNTCRGMDSTRITPATEFEINHGLVANVDELFMNQVPAPFNPLQIYDDYYRSHNNTPPSQFGGQPKDWLKNYTIHIAKEHEREFIQKKQEVERLAEELRFKKLRETARPNPKEVEIEPIEVEPIKEVEKYSPLMIAGILVVIVLFLRRRA